MPARAGAISSHVTAPIMAIGSAILKPSKIAGSAFGRRTFQKICHGDACMSLYRFISSFGTSVRPRTELITTGKNDSRKASAYLEGASRPSAMTMMGASATFGVALMPTIAVMTICRRSGTYTETTASEMPITTANANPTSASWSVKKLLKMIRFENFSHSANTREAGGRMSFCTLKTRVPTSHSAMTEIRNVMLNRPRWPGTKARQRGGVGRRDGRVRTFVAIVASLLRRQRLGRERPLRRHDQFSNVRRVLDEHRILERLHRPRPRELVLHDLRDPAGTRGHAHDAVGQEDGLLDTVRDEQHGFGTGHENALQLE